MALNYTILHKNRITTTVSGALSHTYADQDEYDTSNYRNELDASYMGRPWVTSSTSSSPGETNVFEQESKMTGAQPWVGTTTQDAEAMDDRLNAVAPFPELKKRTKLIIWDGAGGTGNVLFEGWADRIESFSIGTYQTL